MSDPQTLKASSKIEVIATASAPVVEVKKTAKEIVSVGATVT
jgi:hypothetical protein